VEYLPLHRPTSGSEDTPVKTVTQFEMGILDSLGMLKVDFLGLITLSVMAKACEMIEKRHGIKFDLNNIPLDDPRAFDLLGSGQTAGVFQVEGCLGADTYIGHRTIRELYEDFKARERAGTLKGRELLRTNSCYVDEGRFIPNVIEKVVYSGVKPIYRLVAENNRCIKATADHHFFTQRGWITLGDLNPETDVLLFKSNTSRSGRTCIECGAPMKSEGRRSQRCKSCSARISSNPSRPEVKARISQSKMGHTPWNKGLTAETAKDTLWIKNLNVYNATQKGVTLEARHGPERAAEIRAKLSEKLSGTNNPMYGRPPKETKTYTKSGYREDLGHYVRSSWEADIARVFRYLGWEYQYEPETFELVREDGITMTYTPDFFIPEQTTFYEIKGWMDTISAEKIALFQQQYPNHKLVVIDKTLFAEFQVRYADLVDWECPQFPSDSEWVEISAIEFVGEEDTYDLQMQSPGNNFVANGFVVHNSGMTRYLVQMKPKTLDNIIAMVALYRPGPMAFIPDYIARMHGEAEVEYRHELLEPILKETYGITVYQEQIMYTAMNLGGYTASEADDLRKAVAKKKADVLLNHRQRFVSGAEKRGISTEIANQIFDDWEAFARYGFPKGHAADYGVIAVETAYLKVHYTAEYMTALLSAWAGQTEKVAYYVADARSMGLPVLAPDVNASSWDFSIEDIADKPNIRFGLGAVKNAGQAAVELIIQEREQNGRFKDLNDFARRVDLRAVGKRALECLIKVGALDAFGNRAALLAALDRIIAISNTHFRAADIGQLSLFGAATGVVEEITLPEVNNVDRREMLNWERELIGLYISDHPLTPYQQTFAQIVSYFSGQLHEAQHEEKVRVAGLVTSVRPYMTKTNKPMGFVAIEDIQGTIELVLFPKTWEKYREQLTVGQVIIVEGKTDTGSTPPKVLVDTIRTEITILEPLDTALRTQPMPVPSQPVVPESRPGHVQNVTYQSTQPKPIASQPNPAPPAVKQVTEKEKSYSVGRDVIPPYDEFDGMPPPPDNFPEDWETQWQPSFEEAALASKPEPKFKKTEEVTPPQIVTETALVETHEPDKEEATPEAVLVSLPPIYIPVPKEDEQKRPPQQITVTLRTTGDKERDRRRIKTIYGTLISFHGRDRFSFQVFENGSGYLIDFPNDTTRVCPEMLDRLKKLIGEENWRVEEITFQ
jgi:hypothetical protein